MFRVRLTASSVRLGRPIVCGSFPALQFAPSAPEFHWSIFRPDTRELYGRAVVGRVKLVSVPDSASAAIDEMQTIERDLLLDHW